jgi:hypothetical protein
MNRSILIVICDFLLVSLLAFSTVDVNKLSHPGVDTVVKMELPTTNQVTGREDLSGVMEMALAEERKNRNALLSELSKTKDTVGQREQQIQAVQTLLQTKEQQIAQAQQQQADLAGEVAAAQTNIANLNQKLQATAAESVISKEQRAAMEAEARKQSEKASELERRLAQLQASNQLVEADRTSLNTQLQVSEASRRAAVAQMSELQGEVTAQREVNAKLADGVKTLATKSSELAQEIRDNRQLAPNEIFEQLSTNRVLANFYGLKPGVFGTDSTKYKQTQIVVATDGTNTFALCHVQDTPLTLWDPGTQWEDLSGTIAHGDAVFPIDSVSFSATDPRVVWIPISADQAHSLGCKIYRFSRDPFKFQDAVVVGTRDNYYGECKFQLDVDNPQYVKMDRSSLRGLFGKFNPSSGDLVLSKTGELLGVMANNNYGLFLRSFDPGIALRFGPASHNQPTGKALSSLYAVLSQMPDKLQ